MVGLPLVVYMEVHYPDSPSRKDLLPSYEEESAESLQLSAPSGSPQIQGVALPNMRQQKVYTLALCPWFLAQSLQNSCNFLSDETSRSISYSLTSIPDTRLLKLL